MRHWFATLYRRWKASQTPIILPLTVLAVGVVTAVLGNRAAHSFLVAGGNTMLHIMGIIMVVGSTLIIGGFVRHSTLAETIGLVIASLGTAIYGVGTLIDLGELGLATGIGYIGITVTLLSRVVFILQLAIVRKQLGDAL